MHKSRVILVSAIIVSFLSSGPARAWSLFDEVVVVDPGLTANLVWELINSKTYCQSMPANLDRLSCAIQPDPAEFWFGLDAAGNSYGTINGADAAGEYFDVYRRPAGTKLSQHIARITRRKEPVFGQVTKLQLTGGFAIDQTSGVLLIGITGSCLSAACVAQADTTDHLGVIRITGLPTMFDLALTYQSPGELALRMPVRPEGLPSADSIDVYYGPVTLSADLSSALPLACHVAGSAGPGDTVTVADPLPAPPVGQPRYYVAAVTHGSDRRAGRQNIDGVVQGRETSGLPACP
ncbi:MAG: hypothetical protein ACREAA_16695 [Candidatus Polarisedimenticolia bacterium]